MNDPVTGTDTHGIIPASGGPPLPTPHPYAGRITSGCAGDVLINGQPAAIQGSGSMLYAPHIPIPPAGSFAVPPTGQGTVTAGSPTVLVGGRPLARLGDQVQTCNDPVPAPTSSITGGSPNVMVG
jgi:uncharacterized Zn-binding protein involved in type VI secretion